jgi:uncharacterized membrane protein HdeD (DUF308 family)
MANILKHAWWTLLLRGIVAILFALFLIFAPGITLATGAVSFALLFGIYALVDGVSTIVSAVLRREGQWVLLLLLGIVGVIAGLAVLANPLLFAALSVRIVIFIFAFKALAGGIVEIISAWRLREEIDNEWLLALNGLFSVIFGVILIARPITALEVLVLLASFYLLVSGVMLVILAFKMRGWSGKVEALKPA